MRRTITIVASGMLLAAPLVAQQPADPAVLMQQRIEALLSLPQRATEIRRNGVPDSTVRSVLDILVKQKVPATEAVTILENERDASAEHGPTDNFGAFVQSQLAAGKRGQALAAAIRAEHQARGKGKPAKVGGRPDDAGHDGRPEGAGRGGRPEAAGRDGKDEPGMRQKPANDTTRGKRPGNPNAKHPN